MTKRFRLDLAYDGTDFHGWQNQDEGRTVQGLLEAALAQILKTPTAVTGAGRTDAGVHARGQTAHFDAANTRMTGLNMLRALNSLLPPDIRITDCREVEADFHSRFSALARVYHYYFIPSQTILPWEARYNTRINRAPDLEVLNSMSSVLKGEIDFTTFSHAQDASQSRCRYIYHAAWFPQGDKIVFKIAGNAFLWRMVRSLVGSLLDFEARGMTKADFQRILEARDRLKAGPTAPSNGLFLHKVIYDEREFGF